ncbi:MAG: SOS-response repressor and protease LexA, partial [uncultured Solirubrobacteraceae bacterium]
GSRSDQAPAGDLRLHQAPLGEARLPTHRARHRQGRRAGLLVDGARASREPREARPAAPRPDQAARDRVARPRRRTGQVDRATGRAAARRPGRRRLAGARRGEHRGVRGRPVPGGWRGGRVRPADPRRVDDRGRDPARRLRGRPATGHRQGRRDRRRAARRGGDRQALLPRSRPHPPAARERDDGADPLARRARARARRRPVQERAV